MLGGYIRPNGLEEDEDFFTYDFMSVCLKSLGKYIFIKSTELYENVVSCG
jgi:hypothetical protein